jgi:hypothetical protein
MKPIIEYVIVVTDGAATLGVYCDRGVAERALGLFAVGRISDGIRLVAVHGDLSETVLAVAG